MPPKKRVAKKAPAPVVPDPVEEKEPVMEVPEPPPATGTNLVLGPKTYDTFKRTALLYLPAIGALYFALSQIWGLPKAEEVVGTIAALNAFLGISVTASKHQYNKSEAGIDGQIVAEPKDGGTLFSLELNSDPVEAMANKDKLVFKVR